MKNLAKDYTVNQHPAKGFRIHLIVFACTIPVIWLVWFFTDQTYPWQAWQTSAWAIGLLFHYLGVFIFKKKN